MKGRGNNDLTIRLIRSHTRQTVYHIVVTRKKTDGQGRIDSIGKFVKINDTQSYLKIDLTKLNYYLYQNISFSPSFAKVTGIYDAICIKYDEQ